MVWRDLLARLVRGPGAGQADAFLDALIAAQVAWRRDHAPDLSIYAKLRRSPVGRSWSPTLSAPTRPRGAELRGQHGRARAGGPKHRGDQPLARGQSTPAVRLAAAASDPAVAGRAGSPAAGVPTAGLRDD